MGRQRLFRDEFTSGTRPEGLQPFLLPTVEEMERFTLHLDQILSENINKQFFGDEIDDYAEDASGVRRPKGTIRLLREWLDQRYPQEGDLGARVTSSMAEVRRLRQKPAHRPTTNAIDATVWDERARLLGEVHDGLRTLRRHLMREPTAGSVEIPVWLDAEVRRYWGPAVVEGKLALQTGSSRADCDLSKSSPRGGRQGPTVRGTLEPPDRIYSVHVAAPSGRSFNSALASRHAG